MEKTNGVHARFRWLTDIFNERLREAHKAQVAGHIVEM